MKVIIPMELDFPDNILESIIREYLKQNGKPVKTARWIERDPFEHGWKHANHLWECSGCHSMQTYGQTSFCMSCGAMMMGKGEKIDDNTSNTDEG